MSSIIEALAEEQYRSDIPDIRIGNVIRVYFKVKEQNNKERLQAFEGTVIAMKGKGLSKTFTVRRLSGGFGVERIFPLYSPKIGKIEIIGQGKVRRAKLFYLRDRVGKAAKLKFKLVKKD